MASTAALPQTGTLKANPAFTYAPVSQPVCLSANSFADTAVAMWHGKRIEQLTLRRRP